MATVSAIPYESARRNVDRIGIKFDELPHHHFWAPLFGRLDEAWRINITAKVMASSAAIGRELSQSEKDAIAENYAQLLRTQDLDGPWGVAAAVGFYLRTRASYGFPLYTPSPEKFNPNKFLGLESPMAPRAWHGLRFVAWYAAWRVVTGIFCTSFAITGHERRYATDSRLQDYRRAAAEIRARRMQLQRTQQMVQRGLSGMPSMPPATTGWAGTEPSFQDTQNTQNARDARDAQAAQEAQSTWPGMQSPQQETPPASYTDEPSVFDEASPVSPSDQQQESSPQQPFTSGGSAWDRLRAQARGRGAAQSQASGVQATAWGRKREDELISRGAQQGTSYTYSSGDEERAYAKEQAQKEFDEMLERERRGQSDSSGRR